MEHKRIDNYFLHEEELKEAVAMYLHGKYEISVDFKNIHFDCHVNDDHTTSGYLGIIVVAADNIVNVMEGGKET